jgi:hypothetical protein
VLRLICAVAIVTSGCGGAPAPTDSTDRSPWIARARGDISVQAYSDDAAQLDDWLTMAEEGRARVQEFFGLPVDGGLTVLVFPTRAAINAYWQDVLTAPNVQFPCWMVASASRAGVSMLAPRLWEREQCGHDGHAREVGMILTHEVVHVLHARRSTHREINAVMSFKWYNEGIASLAAGMYSDSAGLAASATSVSSLRTVIDLPNSYPIARSMAAFIDARYGRRKHADLLRHASTAEVLDDLGLSEPQFLEAWRAWCCR